MKRRQFVTGLASSSASVGLAPLLGGFAPALFARRASASASVFKISLAQWSLHRSFFAKDLDPLDFAQIARDEFAIDAVEYVNTFFFERAQDQAYLQQMKQRAADAGVRSLLIMCDRLGMVAASTADAQTQTLENHKPWLAAAQFLGCRSIRTNVAGQGGREQVAASAVNGLGRLADLAEPHGLTVLVENHGGISSDGSWLAGVMAELNDPRVGTLPDFGNFRISPTETYDFYQGVTELMPFAKSVSAKSYDFDAEGNETRIDYERMLRIVVAAGYHDYVGVEYEGTRLSEFDGIRATKALLERVRAGIEV